MTVRVLLLAVAALLIGCGGGEPFTGDLMTIVIGEGEKADEPQSVISGIDSIKVGDEVLLGGLACDNRGEKRWYLKKTVTLSRAVSNDTEAMLTLSGPDGSETVEIEFSNSIIPRKHKHTLGGQTIVIQCYASVGDKWGLIIRPE